MLSKIKFDRILDDGIVVEVWATGESRPKYQALVSRGASKHTYPGSGQTPDDAILAAVDELLDDEPVKPTKELRRLLHPKEERKKNEREPVPEVDPLNTGGPAPEVDPV